MGAGTIQNGRREYFRENHSVAVGIGAVRTVIGTFTVPSKARAKLIGFGNYLGTVAAWGVAYWEILANGVPVTYVGGTPRIMDQVGYAAQRQPTSELEFSGGTVVQITGSNPTAAILQMGFSMELEAIYQE